jgi:hypothetical protein
LWKKQNTETTGTGVKIASSDIGNKVLQLFSLEVMLAPYWKKVEKCKNGNLERNPGYKRKGKPVASFYSFIITFYTYTANGKD